MIYTICAICKSNKNTKILYKKNLDKSKINSKTFSARRVPDKVHYRFLKCVKCGLIFSNPIFDEKKINFLYRESTFNYILESKFLRKTYWQYFKETIGTKNLKKINILEIGCGNGFFLDELIKKGAEKVYGIEPGKSSVGKASEQIKKYIKISLLKKGLFPNEFFDVILCFHTLDHVIEVNKFLKITYDLLKTNGKVMFIVHNTNSLSAKFLGERSPIFDIEHIFLFNSLNLNLLFRQNKFKNTKTFNVKNTYPLNYWIYLFPISLSTKKTIQKLLSFARINLLPITLSAGNLGIIGEK